MAKLYEIFVELTYKGVFATDSALTTAYSTGQIGDYAYVSSTTSYWYWSTSFSSWVNQQISESGYIALSTAQKAAVPYIVGV